MSDNSDPRSDAQLLADWSMEAIRIGRLQVGEAILRLAIQAYRTEQAESADQRAARAERNTVRVPFLGATRSETPRLRAVAPAGPTGNGDADLAREHAAATAIIPIDHNSPGIDRRCRALDVHMGIESECHGAVYWVPAAGAVGDGYWRHVDTALDNAHVPVVEA